jgi:hypothetical protein
MSLMILRKFNSFFPFNAARDYILMRRQPGGCFELSRKVIGAEMDDRRHLLQGRIVSEIFHNVLNDPAELVAWKCTVRCDQLPLGTREVTNQVHGQNRGEWLGGDLRDYARLQIDEQRVHAPLATPQHRTPSLVSQ